MAIPEDEVFGINFRPLIYLTPVACAIGTPRVFVFPSDFQYEFLLMR